MTIGQSLVSGRPSLARPAAIVSRTAATGPATPMPPSHVSPPTVLDQALAVGPDDWQQLAFYQLMTARRPVTWATPSRYGCLTTAPASGPRTGTSYFSRFLRPKRRAKAPGSVCRSATTSSPNSTVPGSPSTVRSACLPSSRSFCRGGPQDDSRGNKMRSASFGGQAAVPGRNGYVAKRCRSRRARIALMDRQMSALP